MLQGITIFAALRIISEYIYKNEVF